MDSLRPGSHQPIRAHLVASLLAMLFTSPLSAVATIHLAGRWRFQLDRANVGAAERWDQRTLGGTFDLPGTLPGRGIGDPVTVDTEWTGGIFDRSWFTAPEYAPYRQPGNIKVPFWLQPETHYVGAAWFQRDFELPAAWAGRRVTLLLERPHWKTRVWLDGVALGSGDSLSVAHEFPLDPGVAPGRHQLTVRVDNTLDPDIGENSHSVSDHTQGNWNGIVGRIELRATAPVWIDELEVFGRVADRTAVVRGRLGRLAGHAWPASLRLTNPAAPDESAARTVPVAPDGTFTASFAFGADAALWDEFQPALHRLNAELPNGEHRAVTFGFRQIEADGRQLRLNGRPLFLRGTLDAAIFPRTGHPPTDEAGWRKVFAAIRAHGLNHVRFHSWCPPEAAFAVADELGLYLQIEAATWPNQSTTLGDGQPVDAWVNAETERIRRAYGNHPSFLFFAVGNEPGGDHHVAWVADWVRRQRVADPRRLHNAGAGWPEVPENDFHIASEPRIQHWGEGLASRVNARPPETRTDYRDYILERAAPVVAHEIGQWCVYPNFAEMPKYTGHLKPRNLEIFQASLAAHGMADQARDFLLASGKLQALCYKEDIEAALRTPGMGGFQLLGLQDFPGQGTALVGVLDAFWEEKGYLAPADFRRFCNTTVPLARLDRRVFTTAERLTADLEVAHFGAAPLPGVAAHWALVADDGRLAAQGDLPARDLAVGAAQSLGRLDLPLGALAAPARYRLVLGLPGTSFANDWDIWVYPPAAAVVAPAPGGVALVSRLDAAATARLAAGGTVWLMAPPRQVRPDPARGPIALGFSSIFWNTAWTNGQAPHTLGVLCDPRHPAFGLFPTDPWSNWQWWYPLQTAAPMILDGLPVGLRPIVQIIDDWVTNRKLGLVFEARVGPGRLLVSSIDLDDGALDPVRRQLRASLLAYVASDAFRPATAVTVAEIQGVFVDP